MYSIKNSSFPTLSIHCIWITSYSTTFQLMTAVSFWLLPLLSMFYTYKVLCSRFKSLQTFFLFITTFDALSIPVSITHLLYPVFWVYCEHVSLCTLIPYVCRSTSFSLFCKWGRIESLPSIFFHCHLLVYTSIIVCFILSVWRLVSTFISTSLPIFFCF